MIILLAKTRIIFKLKGILRSFSNSTSLHVNFSKSVLTPIDVDDSQTNILAETYGCKVGGILLPTLASPLAPLDQI